MSAGLQHSTIETFRQRIHPDCVLKLYALQTDGETLALVDTVERGFLLTPNTDLTEGAAPFTLTIDKIYTDSLTDFRLKAFSYFDLVNHNTAAVNRYRLDSEMPPQVTDWRYIYGVHAAYDDRKQVTGVVIVPDEPPISSVSPVITPYICTQATPLAVWIINHNLGYMPTVELIGTDGEEMDADVLHVSINQVRVTFISPTAGTARLL